MEINYLRINGFGKIKNKEINLEKNINLIYGKNESGKSTALKFIQGMFYGISKNKNGKTISDYEKYKPWNGEDFSGKIKYTLNNKKEYEVYRDFTKKNPIIYNNNLEDISKEFNIEKTKGNQFFYEQTKIDEDLFLSTNIVEQAEVVLDVNNQGLLTQKIANILSSGSDNISYKKVMDNLNKKLIQDVGTERTTGRPINDLLEKINILKKEKENLDSISDTSNEIEEGKKELNADIKNIENEIQLLKEIKTQKEIEKKEIEKINENKNTCEEYEEKINALRGRLNSQELKNEKRKGNIKYLFSLLTIVILLIVLNFIKTENQIINNCLIIGIVIWAITIFVSNSKSFSKIKNNNIETIKIEKEMEILEDTKREKEEEIIQLKNDVEDKKIINLNTIKNKYRDDLNTEDIIKLFNYNYDKINNEYEILNKELNNKKIELNALNYNEEIINSKLEQKIKCEEQIESLEEEKKELLELEQSINIAKVALEEAYNEMKNEVTPKFTKDLSMLIEKISSSKYKKASFDAE